MDYLEKEVEKRSDEMKHIEIILQEKEEVIIASFKFFSHAPR